MLLDDMTEKWPTVVVVVISALFWYMSLISIALV